MGKFRYSWDEAKIKRYIKEGRGKGRGKEYNPWRVRHYLHAAHRFQ